VRSECASELVLICPQSTHSRRPAQRRFLLLFLDSLISHASISILEGYMPSNDLLLLDSILQKNKAQYGARSDEGEYFELFSMDSVLKNYELSLEQLEDGWVDGGDDGGLDGFYTL
jgi:hypothetical protein